MKFLQKLGKALMLPVAVLPICGILMGIGYYLCPATMQGGEVEGIKNLIGFFLVKAGSALIENMAILFAIGVAIGMAKNEKAVAALAGAIAFLVMNSAVSAMIDITNAANTLPDGSLTVSLGITTLQTGVFGGIIVGLGTAYLHNKYYKIELPQVLSFFGGTRFVPIICSAVYLLVGILLFYIWPTIQLGISAIGSLVLRSGYIGTLIYGIIERALIPFGLHHVFYIPFWQTSVGGTAIIDGTLVEGAQNIYFAELASPSTTAFNIEATRFMAGKFPLMIFGLPGAAFAIYRCARPEQRKVVGGLMISAALTSMLTGITEPLEFTFLFIAPGLYGIHCVFAGLAYMMMHVLKITVGLTFSGGLIDLFFFGIMQGQEKTNWMMVIPLGIVYFIVYYFLFHYINAFLLLYMLLRYSQHYILLSSIIMFL